MLTYLKTMIFHSDEGSADVLCLGLMYFIEKYLSGIYTMRLIYMLHYDAMTLRIVMVDSSDYPVPSR